MSNRRIYVINRVPGTEPPAPVIPDHNDLEGLQGGGEAGEMYHLSEAANSSLGVLIDKIRPFLPENSSVVINGDNDGDRAYLDLFFVGSTPFQRVILGHRLGIAPAQEGTEAVTLQQVVDLLNDLPIPPVPFFDVVDLPADTWTEIDHSLGSGSLVVSFQDDFGPLAIGWKIKSENSIEIFSCADISNLRVRIEPMLY